MTLAVTTATSTTSTDSLWSLWSGGAWTTYTIHAAELTTWLANVRDAGFPVHYAGAS